MVSYNARGKFDDTAYHLAHVWSGEGVPVAEISRRLHSSRPTVRLWLGRLKPPSQHPSRPLSKAVSKRIAARRSVVERLVTTKVKIVGERFTQKRRQRTTQASYRWPYASAGRIARKIKQGDPNAKASKSTVLRDLRLTRKAYCRPQAPRLSKKNMATRLAFARRLLSPQELPSLRRIAFSDEKWFDTDDGGRTWQWLRPGEMADPLETTKYGPRLMVWAVIGVNYRKIVRVPATMKVNESVYTDLIGPAMRDLRRRSMIFQQDNAPGHAAAVRRGWFAERKVVALQDWPPYSPDLSPIETLWAMLARRVSERAPFGEDELWQFVEEEFAAVPEETVTRLVLSFERRLRVCRGVGGTTVSDRMLRTGR